MLFLWLAGGGIGIGLGRGYVWWEWLAVGNCSWFFTWREWIRACLLARISIFRGIEIAVILRLWDVICMGRENLTAESFIKQSSMLVHILHRPAIYAPRPKNTNQRPDPLEKKTKPSILNVKVFTFSLPSCATKSRGTSSDSSEEL